MQITQREFKQAVVLDLKGDLTYDNRGVFKDAVERVKTTHCRHLIINMEQVQFLDSSGLGLMALMSQNLKLSHMRLSVVNPQSYVREIMNLANIAKLVPIYNSEADAVADKVSTAA
jgi:anti-anti-sigma factor